MTVTRLLLGVATWRLAMSAGRHAALAGMLTGPARQASHAPVTSVPPVRERTISRHGSFSGRPRAISRMLVPQDVPVRVMVTRTRVAGFAADRMMAAGGLGVGWASQNPPAATAAAAAPAPGPAPRVRARPGTGRGIACQQADRDAREQPGQRFQEGQLGPAFRAGGEMRLNEHALGCVCRAERVDAEVHGHRAGHVPVIPCSSSTRRSARRA